MTITLVWTTFEDLSNHMLRFLGVDHLSHTVLCEDPWRILFFFKESVSPKDLNLEVKIKSPVHVT